MISKGSLLGMQRDTDSETMCRWLEVVAEHCIVGYPRVIVSCLSLVISKKCNHRWVSEDVNTAVG